MRSDQLKIHVRKRKNVFPIPHEAFHCVVWTSLSQESHTELHQMLLTIPNTSLSYPYPHLTPLYNWPLYIKLLRLDCPLGQESKNPTDTPTMTQRALKNWCKVNPQGWTTWLLWSWWGCDKGPCEMHEAISNQTLAMGQFFKSWSCLLLKKQKKMNLEWSNEWFYTNHQILILFKCWLYFKRPMIQSTPFTLLNPLIKADLLPSLSQIYWYSKCIDLLLCDCPNYAGTSKALELCWWK